MGVDLVAAPALHVAVHDAQLGQRWFGEHLSGDHGARREPETQPEVRRDAERRQGGRQRIALGVEPEVEHVHSGLGLLVAGGCAQRLRQHVAEVVSAERRQIGRAVAGGARDAAAMPKHGARRQVAAIGLAQGARPCIGVDAVKQPVGFGVLRPQRLCCSQGAGGILLRRRDRSGRGLAARSGRGSEERLVEGGEVGAVAVRVDERALALRREQLEGVLDERLLELHAHDLVVGDRKAERVEVALGRRVAPDDRAPVGDRKRSDVVVALGRVVAVHGCQHAFAAIQVEPTPRQRRRLRSKLRGPGKLGDGGRVVAHRGLLDAGVEHRRHELPDHVPQP